MAAKDSMSRREFLKFLGLTAAAGVMGACSPRPQSQATDVPQTTAGPQATDVPEDLPDELVMVWQNISNQDVMFQPVLDQWQADFGIPVRWIQTPNIEEQVARILSLYIAGERMDVIADVITNFAQFIDEGIIIPLDDMPGLEEYFEVTPASVRSLTQYNGRTYGIMQWIASQCGAYNMRMLEQGGWDGPPESWEEWEDHCLKAKQDGISTYPTLWMAGTGIDHLNSVFYSLVSGAGGTVTESDGTPMLGPGSIAREVLTWWARSFLETEISDPRSLELRYYPAAAAFAQGEHLYHLGTRQTFFTSINGGDSPTIGQHEMFKQPGGRALITGDHGCIGSSSASPETAWNLLQYLIGKTRDGEWLGPINLASIVLTPYPSQVVEDPDINALWSSLFSIDIALETLEDTVAVTEIAPAILTTWWPQWQESVNTNLSDCLAGRITADEAADAMEASALELRG